MPKKKKSKEETQVEKISEIETPEFDAWIEEQRKKAESEEAREVICF